MGGMRKGRRDPDGGIYIGKVSNQKRQARNQKQACSRVGELGGKWFAWG